MEERQEEEERSPLLRLPDIPLAIVFKHLALPSIFRLRKVCRSLRTYIDTTKPDLNYEIIDIRIDNYFLRFYARSPSNTACMWYYYWSYADLEKFIDDFKNLLTFKRTKPIEFHLFTTARETRGDFNTVLDRIVPALAACQEVPQFDTLLMNVWDENDAIRLLNHMDQSTIKHMKLKAKIGSVVNIRNLCLQPYWQNLVEFNAGRCFLNGPLRQVVHMNYANMQVLQMTLELFPSFIKAILATETTRQRCYIYGIHQFDNEQLQSMLGPALEHRPGMYGWFIRSGTRKSTSVIKLTCLFHELSFEVNNYNVYFDHPYQNHAIPFDDAD